MSTVNSANIYIAYICPHCFEASLSELSLFELSGNCRVDLVCSCDDCSEKCVSISRSNSKFRISIYCAICGGVHEFIVSQSAFVSQKLLAFSCLDSDIGVFFCGKKDEVEKAVEQNIEYINALEEEIENDDYDLYSKILEAVKRLSDEGKILCSCGCDKIFVDTIEDEICLVCSKCFSYYPLEANQNTLDELENSEFFEI